MGTRSLTFVYDSNDKPLVCMYRQFDGYPSGYGKELAEFLKPLKMVNGLGVDVRNVANGAGCLAAQMVAHFKNGPGGIYLYAPEPGADHWQDFEYHVYASDEGIRVRVTDPNTQIFEGSVEAFLQFCTKREEE